MKRTDNTLLLVGEYFILLSDLYKGYKPDTTKTESTIIRFYQDFKKRCFIPENYSSDELLSDISIPYIEDEREILFLCLYLLENAINTGKVDSNNIPLDLKIFFKVVGNEEDLWQFLIAYFKKIELV